MKPFVEMAELGHEQVILCRNDDVGLRAIIAIHNTTLGPALGGCRLYDYASEAEAMTDALRLSRGMTYKAAIAGLDLGGGKSVIIGDRSIKSEALFRAFGRQIESLAGRYITAEDMNTNVQDMNDIRRETQWVTGVGAHAGGSGDPSPITAWGVFNGLRACLEVVYGTPSVSGRTVAIQGIGNVGYNLAKYLHERGAKLVFSDINAGNIDRAMSEFGGTVVEGDEFFQSDVDVLAPCAIGGIINKRTIEMIKAPIVAGGANNVLANEDEDCDRLREKNIILAPDYVINAGGLMSVYSELRGWPADKAMDDAGKIFTTVKSILSKANADGISSIQASNRIAEARIESVAKLQRLRVG
ncbi:MAG: leucine dehydrogenase [Rhodobacterales bacterium]|nr:leucine dehydrogenase [Rhodobacterales bacterium]